MGFLDLVETPAAILGGEAEGVQCLANEGPKRLAVALADFGHGDDLIDDAGQFVAGLGAVDLGGEDAPIEVVELLVEDPDEPDVLASRVLQVGEPGDHLLAVQAVGAAHVGLAGTLGDRLRLALAPLEAQPSGNRDAVDEDGLVLIQRRRVAEAITDRLEMRLAVDLVFAKRRVRPTDEDGEVAAFLPSPRADGVARPALDGEIAGL
ncbi:hypothetical protein THPR109532_17325 [Thalassospira profundimaris]